MFPMANSLNRVVEMVKGVRKLGLEACCTLGMLREDQAEKLAEAGFDRIQSQSRHFA